VAKIKFSYVFLFYFLRQLYSVIYDMSCGCDVMPAASVQLTPQNLGISCNRNIAGVCVFHSPICGSTYTYYFISERYNLSSKIGIEKHTQREVLLLSSACTLQGKWSPVSSLFFKTILIILTKTPFAR
jgi:hypothetical protein